MNEGQPAAPYDYPTREHLNPLITPSDWINDEMRIAGGGSREARDNLYVDLRNLYRHAPYVKLLGSLASRLGSQQMAHEAQNGLVGGDRSLPLRQQALYSGMLLGVRAELMPAQRSFRQEVLNTGSHDMNRQIKWAYGHYLTGLKYLPDETCAALDSTVSGLFVDLPARQAACYQLDFTQGYVTTATNVNLLRSYALKLGGPIQYE